MHTRDLFLIVEGDLKRNLRRTILTMFGLIVGSAAVVIVTSVSLTGRQYAVRQLESLGSNLIYALYDGPTPSSNDLTEQDYRSIVVSGGALAGVSRLALEYTELNIHGEEFAATLVGTDGEYAQVRNIVPLEGRFLTSFDVGSRRKVCVLPESLALRLFGRGHMLRQLVRVEGLNFQVVGVFRDIQSFGIPTELSQNAVIIPITVLEGLNNSERIDRIYAQAPSRAQVERATRHVIQVLAANHGTDVIYRVGNMGEVLAVISRVSKGLTLLVAVVSAISLLVGGVGIMNIMLVTVKERTTEIGLRKALGARSREIMGSFLTEGLVISIAGGLIGILVGASLPVLVTAVFDVAVPISLLSMFFALAVSSGVGVVFGYYPARLASRLNPAQAMRYEG